MVTERVAGAAGAPIAERANGNGGAVREDQRLPPWGAAAAQPPERDLTAAWLLGWVPAHLLPWPLLRPGRAGRGPGPDVREAAFLTAAGVPRSGDVEVHRRASDFRRHGHDRDPAYDRVLLHLVWEDDLERPLLLAVGGRPPTVAVGPALAGDPGRLRALLRRGPRPPGAGELRAVPPCAAYGGPPATAAPRGEREGGREPRETIELVRAQGHERLAERVWRAARLAEAEGWGGAWERLLERALIASRRGRQPVPTGEIRAGGGRPSQKEEPWRRLVALARERRPRALIEALRGGDDLVPERLGPGRAAEVGWNAALPLLAALAAAYGDLELARCTAALADAWPAPRPYGRTRALEALLLGDREGEGEGEHPIPRGPRVRTGALWAQWLLHLQELWCECGGCGVCPLTRGSPLT